MSSSFMIVLTGGLVASACALVGSFLVLRKMALMGDAISHAVLPGIALAFFFTHSRAALPMLIGAGAVGLLTVVLVELFIKSRRMYEDTSIGVVFPALFSIGVILISRYASKVDLDLDCVLYGEIAYVPLQGFDALAPIAGVLLIDVLMVLLFYKELKITTFDPDLAYSVGISPIVFHYMLMFATSLTVVASFESVGAILVVAMLIVPAATAYLLFENLGSMITAAVGIGWLASGAGYFMADKYDFSIAGGMAVVSGVIFMLVFLFSPRHGLAARYLRNKKLERNVEGRLFLLHLVNGAVSAEEIRKRFRWAGGRLNSAARRLKASGLLTDDNGAFMLTDAGRRAVEEERASGLAHQIR